MSRHPGTVSLPETGADTGKSELKRTIGLWRLAAIGIGGTIGTGIFFILSQAVPLAGPAVIWSFVIAGIVAGLTAVCYAELAFDPFYPQQVATPRELNLAETVPGPTTAAFAARAAELGVVVVLNVFERSGQQTFDSSPVIDADGQLLGVTRMCHITD